MLHRLVPFRQDDAPGQDLAGQQGGGLPFRRFGGGLLGGQHQIAEAPLLARQHPALGLVIVHAAGIVEILREQLPQPGLLHRGAEAE